ncbi:MAG: class I SAM-dependent methyltransferase [Gammaproteobacteria bacterium]|nr:class I SAM-dependent methyltransferase [Gammaproteobacteria bacterium]
MTTHEKKTFFATYDWAKSWKDLPWAHDEPTLFLSEICRLRKPGRALDIGCGAGTDSVYLASQGWDVTSLDFMPKALAYTAQRAAEKGVKIRPVEADITEWVPDRQYDLVLDHGLLHNMDPVRYPAYRATVMKALASDGEFVLLHWHPRFPGQGNGKMGPTRVDREQIQAFFAPELQERFFAREEFEDLPDMVGGGMSQAYYWFRPNLAWQRPAELLEQVRSTLKSHGIAADGTAPPIAAELLARVVGPGRLGISHRNPAAAETRSILAQWCEKARVEAADAARLLNLFASDQGGKICVAGAPRCDNCAVRFCKRLRYR